MVAMSVIAAESDDEAKFLASSMEQSFAALRTGNPGRMKPPIAGFRESLPPEALASMDAMRSVSAIGGADTVRAAMQRFIARTGADELILGGSIWDPAAQRRSLEITMAALA